MEDDKDQQSPAETMHNKSPDKLLHGLLQNNREIVKWVNLSEEGKEIILKRTERRRSNEHKTRSAENAIWIS